MKFDTLQTYPCLRPASRHPQAACAPVSGGGGGGVPPPNATCCDDPDFAASMPFVCQEDDSRCTDPAFAAANPGLCLNAPRLLLKPAYLLKTPAQQTQFALYFLANGRETLLTSGVTFQSGDPDVAVIGGGSGKLSTVGAGQTQISAAWNGLSAYGQVRVVEVDSCPGTDFVLLLDNSKSMTAAFSGMYADRLTFIKAQARDWIDTIDLSLDKVAVFVFSGGGTPETLFSQDAATIEAAISAVSASNGQTSLKAGLQSVTDYLDSIPAGGRTRCIVLCSDGENKTGGNPIPLAQTFQAGGNILAVLGARAAGSGFGMLETLARDGFFINGTSSNQSDVGRMLAGIKGYLCSGMCEPPGDVCVPYAKLNYAGFVNWNVGGVVDLIGNGGRPLYDLVPGHGLYVDMAGSGPPWKGTLVSKTAFTFASGTTYRLRLKVAGNQRIDAGPWTLRVLVPGLLDQTIEVTDWLQDFTESSFTFAGANVDALVSIALEDVPAAADPSYGLLIDEFVLEASASGDFDDTVTVLADDFDAENSTCFPVNCRSGEADSNAPASCLAGSAQPGDLRVIGWHDNLIPLAGCTPPDGEAWCLGGQAWDGVIPFTGSECNWGFGDEQASNTLAGGVRISFATIGLGDLEDEGHVWNLAIALRGCTPETEADTFTIWQGTKLTGSTPLGVYTRSESCAASPASIGIQAASDVPCPATGCLDDAPIPEQLPDANPAPELEGCGAGTPESESDLVVLL